MLPSRRCVCPTRVKGDIHIDSSNLPGTTNLINEVLILTVCLPKRGGDLWVELGGGDVVRGSIVEPRSQASRCGAQT